MARLRKICSARMTETTAAMPGRAVAPALLDPALPRGFDRVVDERVGHRANLLAGRRRGRGRSRRGSRSSASSSSETPRPRSTSSVCSPSSGAGRRWNRSGPRENRIGSVLCRAGPGDGVVDLLEEAAVLQLRQRRLLVGLHHLRHRDARRPEAVDDLVAAPLVAPASTGARRWRRAAAAGPPRSSAPGPSPTPGRPSASRRAEPLVVGRRRRWRPRRRARPSSSASARQVQVLGRGGRPSVPVALEERAVGRVLDDLLGGDVERGVDHRRLDERRPRRCAGGAPARGAGRTARGCRRSSRPRSTARPGSRPGTRSSTSARRRPRSRRRRPGCRATGRRARSRASGPRRCRAGWPGRRRRRGPSCSSTRGV